MCIHFFGTFCIAYYSDVHPWRYSPEEPRRTDWLLPIFLTGFHYLSYQVTTQLSSRGWVDPVPDPILPENFLGYRRESSPGPLGWQSDVLTTIPNRRSDFFLMSCNPHTVSRKADGC